MAAVAEGRACGPLPEMERHLQRGHCFRCGQRWVLGYVDQAAGEYGQFFCAACTDEGPVRKRKREPRTEDDRPAEEGSEDDYEEEYDSGFGCEDDPAPPWPMPEKFQRLLDSDGILVEHVHVGGHNPSSPRRVLRIVCEVSTGFEKRFRSCGTAPWMGARVLSSHLERWVGPDGLAGRRILELGAGCGLPGMVAAQLGASVTLTDVPELRDLLECNVAANFRPSSAAEGHSPEVTSSLGIPPMVRPLRWESKEDLQNILASSGDMRGFDLVLGSDIGYNPDAYGALFQTLRALLTGCLPQTESDAKASFDVDVRFDESPNRASCIKRAEEISDATGKEAGHNPPRALLALPQRSGEFEEFTDFAIACGWSFEILEVVDLEAERGDPLCSPVAVVELSCP